ncbi:MAG: hypothetical protein Q8R17_01195 [bacterium]|nr:hypothetical protein [bacterium]
MNTKLLFGACFSEHTNFLARKFARFRAVALKRLFKTYASTSFMFLFLIMIPIFAHAAPIVPCGTETQKVTDATGTHEVISNPCEFRHFIIGINNVINFLIMIGGSIAAIVFAIAGFLVLTAGPDESKVTRAKGMFWAVLQGFAWMLGAWILVKMVLVGLGVPDAFSFLGS